VGLSPTSVFRRINALEDMVGVQLLNRASPDYLASSPAPISPNDLTAHNCLTYRNNVLPPTWCFGGTGGV
jgi:hypothetical protein